MSYTVARVICFNRDHEEFVQVMNGKNASVQSTIREVKDSPQRQ